MDVTAQIAEGRSLLASGDVRAAAWVLTEAAVHVRDPELARQVLVLAEEGLSRAGRFSKGQWKEVMRLAELHGAVHAHSA